MVTVAHSFILECESRETDLAAPRTCRLLGRLVDTEKGDYWLAEVTPPFIGQHFGLGPEDIGRVILAPKFRGQALLDGDGGITPVYVCRPRTPSVVASLELALDQIEVMLWGELKPLAIPRPVS